MPPGEMNFCWLFAQDMRKNSGQDGAISNKYEATNAVKSIKLVK